MFRVKALRNHIQHGIALDDDLIRFDKVVRRGKLTAADRALLALFCVGVNIHGRGRSILLVDKKMRDKSCEHRNQNAGNQNVDPFRDQNLEYVSEIDFNFVFLSSYLFQSIYPFLRKYDVSVLFQSYDRNFVIVNRFRSISCIFAQYAHNIA